jgi:hypothetical protein
VREVEAKATSAGLPAALGNPRTPRGLESGEGVLLDWGAKIGASARSEGTPPAFFVHTITALDEFREDGAALEFAATAALRFAQRWYCAFNTARLVTQAVLDIHERGGGKEEARKALGFAKWVYEALPRAIRARRPDQLTLLDVLKEVTRA